MACGPDATIVSANRVRKGGVKGFFATEVFELLVEDPAHAPASDGAVDDVDEVEGLDREQRFAAALAAAVDGFEDFHELETEAEHEPELAMADSGLFAGSRSPVSTPVAPDRPTPARPPVTRPPVPRPADAPSTVVPPVPRPASPRPAVTPPFEALDPVPTLWQMLDRYASLPFLAERPPAGVTVVVGAVEHVAVAAAGVAVRAGVDPAQVLLAAAEPCGVVSPWLWVGSPEEAAERTTQQMGRAGGRTRPRIVLAVACGSDDDGRRWVDQVIEAVGAVRRHVAVAARADQPEVEALVARFDADALDLVGLDDAVAPDGLCRLGLPVTTLEGRPASPALWAALAIERSSRVPG